MDQRFQPRWEGAELAMHAVTARLEQIRGALQPPRPDVIDRAADEALLFMEQLEQWFHAQPPGSAYYVTHHKRLPPSGGYPTQQMQMQELPYREEGPR